MSQIMVSLGLGFVFFGGLGKSLRVDPNATMMGFLRSGEIGVTQLLPRRIFLLLAKFAG